MDEILCETISFHNTCQYEQFFVLGHLGICKGMGNI